MIVSQEQAFLKAQAQLQEDVRLCRAGGEGRTTH